MKLVLLSFLILIGSSAFSQTSKCTITLPSEVKKVQGTYPVYIGANCPIRTVEISVMNRWGETVYKSNNLQHDWQGKNSADGTYFILVSGEYATGEKFSVTGYLVYMN